MQELRSGGRELVRKIEEYQPQAWRCSASRPSSWPLTSAARSGETGYDHRDDQVWVLPNPSGLNRATTLDKLVAAYRELDDAPATRGQ